MQPQTEYKTEHNMGQLDFYRYDALLKLADEAAVQCKLPPIFPNNILNYYIILDQVYINFRAIMDKENRKLIDDQFQKLQNNIFDGESVTHNKKVTKINKSLILDLRNMHMKILEVKQVLGLGIPILKKETQMKKMRRVLLGDST